MAKLQVLHDESGKIHAILAPSQSTRRGYLSSSEAEMTVIETEATDVLKVDATDKDDAVARALSSLMESHRVESGRLVPRSKSAN